jgi:hypothetical protein
LRGLVSCGDWSTCPEGIHRPPHVAERKRRVTKRDDDVPFPRQRKVVFNVQILNVLPGPAVPGLAGVLLQELGRDVEQGLTEGLTELPIAACDGPGGRGARHFWRQ